MKKIAVLVCCLLSGCASLFDGPGYWHKSTRLPVPNPPIKTGRLVPCVLNASPGCYEINTETVYIKTPAVDAACTLHHERLHACGWDHLETSPTNEIERCGFYIPLC